jgi:hypothetical protein
MPKLRLPSLVALMLLVSGCTATSGTGTPGTTPATPTRDSSTIDHPTGATDIVLRFEEGGGFVPVDFIATQAPAFSLYGDGTVVFRNPTEAAPDLGDGVMRGVPFRVAKMSEEQIQALLDRAINRGALGIAKAKYDPGTIADAPTATFTINAGSIKKIVSVVGLGMETPPGLDSQALDALADLGTLLRDFDANGTSGAEPYTPMGYRGQIWDAGGPVGIAPRAWPWPDLKPTDFKPPADQPDSTFLRRVLSPDEVSALGLSGIEGGASGMAVKGADKRIYSLTLRPLLPDEQS